MTIRAVLTGVVTVSLTCSAAATHAGSDPMARLTRERAAFIERADREGYRVCPAPKIELSDPEAFGRFDPERNTVVVATWSRLTPEQRQRFQSLAEHTAAQRSAQATFEDGTYGWVFVHELGHWWQSCRQLTRPNSYAEEAGANRIALAFWRKQDPAFAARMLEVFRYLHGAIPSPLPAGIPKQQYLDDHFLEIGPTRGYTWYQADMVLELATESPEPSFHKALSQPLYPW